MGWVEAISWGLGYRGSHDKAEHSLVQTIDVGPEVADKGSRTGVQDQRAEGIHVARYQLRHGAQKKREEGLTTSLLLDFQTVLHQ